MACFSNAPPEIGRTARPRPFLHYQLGLCLLAAIALPAQAQWQTRPAPRQAQPGAFAVLDVDTPPGRLLFAAVYSDPRALYRSSDDGLTWQINPIAGYPRPDIFWAGTVPTQPGVSSRRADLYVTVYASGGGLDNYRCDLLRSSDAGATWKAVARNTPACYLVIDPSAPQVMYSAGIGYLTWHWPALYRSRDGGSTWQDIGTNLKSYPVNMVKAAADGTLYAQADLVYISRDQGDTWTTPVNWPTTGELPAGSIYAHDLVSWNHPVHGTRFAIAATSNGLYQTTDAGATWLPAGLQDFAINSLDLADDTVSGQVQVRIGYRRGLALLFGDTIVSLTNGLPANIDPVPKGGRYVLSAAGLSICGDLQSCVGGTLPHTATLIEYHNSILDHYFMTIDSVEADGIDRGAAGPGWSRTGVTFEVYPDITATVSEPVCRFYGTPGTGPNSHFYTVDRRECADVRADPGWTLESTGAFVVGSTANRYIMATGMVEFYCPRGRTVYRLYNNRFAQNDSNHRYVKDIVLYQSMQAQGWIGESPHLCVIR